MSLQRSWARLHGYYQRRASSLLFKRPFFIDTPRPVISFTFDDFPESALSAGGAILERYGLTGTYYASLGLMETDAPTGRIFGAADLDRLLQRGHELGCHTFSHSHAWDTPTRTFEQSILQNRLALARLHPGVEFKSFSYPISVPWPLTKSRTSKYFLCCRGGGQTINVGPTDLNQLSAFFLEKSRNNIKVVQDLIGRNRDERGWLILATHDVSDRPTPFGCTPRFFEEIVRLAVDSGALVLPIVAALEGLRASSSPELAADRERADKDGFGITETSPKP
jgi:peptidoglycan/xylan/chitin deacetylase (PgdA/CDA1 family)